MTVRLSGLADSAFMGLAASVNMPHHHLQTAIRRLIMLKAVDGAHIVNDMVEKDTTQLEGVPGMMGGGALDAQGRAPSTSHLTNLSFTRNSLKQTLSRGSASMPPRLRIKMSACATTRRTSA
jgi:hypothetical protein